MTDSQGVPEEFSDEELIAAYLHSWSGENSASTSWANDALDDLVHQTPERAWSILCPLVERAATDQILAIIAAGPLEDLLCLHGPAFLDRVEEQARREPRFRHGLAGVWGSSTMEPRVYQRIREVVGNETL